MRFKSHNFYPNTILLQGCSYSAHCCTLPFCQLSNVLRTVGNSTITEKYTQYRELLTKKEKKKNSHLVHIVSRFGWRFYIWYTPLLCSCISLSKGHFPFLIQVTLIPNQKERYILIILYTKDLISVAIRYNCLLYLYYYDHLLTAQRAVTGAGRHSENEPCRAMTTTHRHALTHWIIYRQHLEKM
jgi:hypothetical protein